ncbi:MAG: GHKL domain-containing protein [Candidatus Kerfeldbacteria bacterium]|nr:GHKL domain-containing protein [Candidatus Kerfeldbacteria bacterium]
MSFTEEQKIKRIHAIKGIILSRWFLILGLALVGVVQRIAGVGVSSLTVMRLMVLVILPMLYNISFSFYIHRSPQKLRDRTLHLLSFSQVLVDQLMVTALIYYTGGIESINFFIYFFPLLSATILFSEIEIVMLSLVTMTMYIGLIVFEFQGFIAHYARYHHDPHLYQNIEATVLNTMTIALSFMVLSILAIFVNRIIRDRELQITIERDKVRSILNSLEDGIIMMDTQQHILSMNPPAMYMLQLYDDALKSELHKKNFAKKFHSLIDAILDQPQAKRLGHDIAVGGGDIVTYIQVDSIPIYNLSGSILSWVKVLRDVTREKELDQMKSDFISVAAHQLRTPLSSLKWFFQIMSDGDIGPVNAKQKELLDQAFAKNNQVIEIINNLLDISEMEEGRTEYQFIEDHVVDLVEDVVKSAAVDAERKKIHIELNTPAELLPPIEMDKQKLRMAIQNLVDNAVKYSPNDSTISIRIHQPDGQQLIAITDQGIGIPKKEQAKIFTKFYRATNAKQQESSGSGLGLYIVRHIIQKHRGRIWFESEPRRGTTFYISLPVSKKYHR